jgi:hypothetical protein
MAILGVLYQDQLAWWQHRPHERGLAAENDHARVDRSGQHGRDNVGDDRAVAEREEQLLVPHARGAAGGEDDGGDQRAASFL